MMRFRTGPVEKDPVGERLKDGSKLGKRQTGHCLLRRRFGL